jgi:hypothetical protein
MRTLYLKDSSSRRKQFALTTRICLENGEKVVIKEPCFPEGLTHIKRIANSQQMFAKYYKNVNISKTWVENDMLYAEYINGIQLSDFYLKAIQNNDKDELIKLINYHVELMLGQDNNCSFIATDEFAEIFGEAKSLEGQPALIFSFFEAAPENIIFLNGNNNELYFIDYEWFFDFPIPTTLLKFKIAHQLSFLSGMDDIISLDERLRIINYELSYDEGMLFINKFYNYIYMEKNLDYLLFGKKFEKNILQYSELVTCDCTLFFDTGNGYSGNEMNNFSFTGNEIEFTCSIPENVISVRLDPIEGQGCIISNMEILSRNGIVQYEPINGYKDNNGDMVFTNADPQIEFRNVSHWLKIKYRISIISNFPTYRIFNSYINASQDRDYLATEKNDLIAERNGLIIERDSLINITARYPELTAQNCILFFDTGNGFSEDRTQGYSYTGNEIEITCNVPENTVSVRFDPVEGYGCIISNLEILSYNGVVKYEPINGYKNENEDIIFANIDPQIKFHGVSNWIKIKYRILFLSDFSHYRVLNNFIVTCRDLLTERDGLLSERNNLASERDGLVSERNNLVSERDGLVSERNNLASERDGLVSERNNLASERNNLASERDGLVSERNNLVFERDGLLNSRSWRVTRPLRKISATIRKNKILYLFAKGILSIKRNGIIRTIKKIKSRSSESKNQIMINTPEIPDSIILQPVELLNNNTITSLLNKKFRKLQAIPWFIEEYEKSRINLVIDSIDDMNNLFGGVTVALIIATAYANRYKIPLRIITRTTSVNPLVYNKIIHLNNLKIPEEVSFYTDCDRDITGNINFKLNISKRDIFIATSWWSVIAIRKTSLIDRFFYIMQDIEMFSDHNGDDFCFCSQMINKSNINFIINSKNLFDYFQSCYSDITENGICFHSAFLRNYSQIKENGNKSKYNLCLFSYSNNPLNIFYYGVNLINKCIEMGIIDTSEWEVCLIGQNIPQIVFNNGYTAITKELSGWVQYEEFLNDIDLAISLMSTPYASHVIYEVACSGGVVISNSELNKEDIFELKNVLLSDLEENNFFDIMEKGISLAKDIEQRKKNLEESIIPHSWPDVLKDVLVFMDERIKNVLS